MSFCVPRRLLGPCNEMKTRLDPSVETVKTAVP